QVNRLRITLVGAAGRMGRSIVDVAESEAVDVFRKIDIGDQITSAGADVLVDFSQPNVTPGLCTEVARARTPLVIGTTGHSLEQRNAIKLAAKEIPVLLASNFSVDVNVLFWFRER